MIESVRVGGFRGIGEGVVEELEQVNIIVGKNNSGKSSFLEALFLTACRKHVLFQIPEHYGVGRSIHKGVSYLCYRRMDGDVSALFYEYEEKPIEYEIKWADGGRLWFYIVPIAGSYRILLREPTIGDRVVLADLDWEPTHARYQAFEVESVEEVLEKHRLSAPLTSVESLPKEVEKRLSDLRSALLVDALHINHVKDVLRACWENIKVRGLDDFIIEALREAYEVNVAGVEYTPSGNWLVTIRDGRKRAVRLDDLGDGAKYALALLTEVLVAEPSLLLVEEPECHSHPKGLEHTFDAVFSLVGDMGSQVFITTHSLEAVAKLSQLCRKHGLAAKIHYFTLREGVLASKPLDAVSVEVVTDLGADVRLLDEYE